MSFFQNSDWNRAWFEIRMNRMLEDWTTIPPSHRISTFYCRERRKIRKKGHFVMGNFVQNILRDYKNLRWSIPSRGTGVRSQRFFHVKSVPIIPFWDTLCRILILELLQYTFVINVLIFFVKLKFLSKKKKLLLIFFLN